MRKLSAFTSFCACARSHVDIYSALIHSIVSYDLGSGQQRPISDCADRQSDLGLHCQLTLKNMLSLGAAYVSGIKGCFEDGNK